MPIHLFMISFFLFRSLSHFFVVVQRGGFGCGLLRGLSAWAGQGSWLCGVDFRGGGQLVLAKRKRASGKGGLGAGYEIFKEGHL
jgi:hypothetical protein